ncbi:chlorite dismutase family protein [Roseimicrobium sp. ORNL1]|uniref:chlorite dismutase family protein n=1 Tax=Roseimicrobium sp. ORNL1 TaxID=2711231 RepID=UPI0013E11C71|nr:chlorite dismutase family protein [Roseimicrobium sp. ORNL1]QIF04343.1 chlorite dismutase family protein [Roseimicrobium sp. ORNL1]
MSLTSTPTTSGSDRLYTFVGGKSGPWKVTSCLPVKGDTLPPADRMEVLQGTLTSPPHDTSWMLQGVTSNERYVTRDEKTQLVARQVALGRPEARCAAFIPIRKNAAWWAMTQDERRAVFEDRSHHIQTGLKYLPGVARRLHHCRDLGEQGPFDFLTYFDYPQTEITAFEDLVAALRATEEWKYVGREVDVRLVWDGA